jgi:hypothetical protein
MSAGGASPAGSGRVARLDPFALPVRYRASDAQADERVRLVEISRDRVVMRRAVRGIAMRVSTPVADFRGVAIRIVPPTEDCNGLVAVMLEHRDPGLSVPLFVANDGTDIAVEWQTWARVLGLPTLVTDTDGVLRNPFGPFGTLQASKPRRRKRGRATLNRRRGRRRWKRKPAALRIESMAVHRGEREIVARN